MSNSVTVTVNKPHLDRLRKGGTKTAVRRALGKLAMYGEGEMKRSMKGAKTGRTYGNHQASAPGEAPAVDIGSLKNSIQAKPVGDGSREWEINVGAEYAAHLEFGTPFIAPRPFARPAAEAIRAKVDDAFEEEFRNL